MADFCDKVSYEGPEVRMNRWTQRNDVMVLRSKITVDLNMRDIMKLIVENHEMIDDYTFHNFARQIGFIDHERTGRECFGKGKNEEDDEDGFNW